MLSHAPPPQMPGVPVSPPDAHALQQSVAELLERNSLNFPGAQPVSFARKHLQEIKDTEYFMCEKTDGLRVLLYLYFRESEDGGFAPATLLIDRKNNYYSVTPALKIPHYQYPNDRDKFLFGTLLDGELVHDQYPGEPNPRLNFYVFDCLACDNVNITTKKLSSRLGRIQEWIFKPYHESIKRLGQIRPDDLKPFALKQKLTHKAYKLSTMFSQVLPTLKHGNDGLIFTCTQTEYRFGTDDHILKWKPPHENTIDFKLKLGDFPSYDPQDGENGVVTDYYAMPETFHLLVYHGKDGYRPFTTLFVTPSEWEAMKNCARVLDGAIIECYRTTAGQWKFKAEGDGSPRFRDDKKDANHISTVNSVLKSIEEPVTEADLLEQEESIRRAYLLKEGKPYVPAQAGNAGSGERDAKKRKFSESGMDAPSTNGRGTTPH